jgi:hypothetical protein
VQRSSSESVRTNKIYPAADHEESSLGSRPSTSMIPLLEVFCLLPPQTTLTWQVVAILSNSYPPARTLCQRRRQLLALITGPTKKFIQFLKKSMAEYYLWFDNGYSKCIVPGLSTHPYKAELKHLKHKQLIQIVNLPEYWQIIIMPAQNPSVFPGYTYAQLLLADPPQPILLFYMHRILNLTIHIQLVAC